MRIFHCLCVLLFLSTFISPALAEARTVRVGLFTHHPYIFLDKGTPQGFYIDILKEISKNHDWKIEYVSGSWDEGLDRLKSGEIDIVTSIGYTEDRAKIFDYTKESNISVWGQIFSSNKVKVSSLLDLSGKKVAILKNGLSGKHLIKLSKDFNIDITFIELPSFESIFESVVDGKVDAGVTTNTFGYTNERQYHVSRTPIMFNPFPLYFAALKGKNRDILQTLDIEIKQLKSEDNSFYYKRLDFWFARGSDTHFHIPSWIYYTGAALSIIALAGFLLSGLLRRKVDLATLKLSETNRELKSTLTEKEEARNRLDLHITNTPLAVIEWDTNQNVAEWNRAAEVMFGYSTEEAIGNHASFIFPNLSREEIDNRFQILYAKKGGTDNVNDNLTKTGTNIIGQWFNTPLIDQNGTIYGIASLVEDITDKVEVENQLRELNQQILAKNEDLEQIIYAASHDLRSPLVNIQGYSKEVSLLLNELTTLLKSCELDQNISNEIDMLTATEIPEAFKFIQSSAKKMDSLLNGLLKLSRAGRASLNICKLDANTIVRQILESFDYQISLNNVSVEVDILPECIGDEQQFTHAFSNLISNALKYLSQKRPGRIYITGRAKTDGTIEYSVTDNGIGIADEHQEKIFDIFHRLNPKEEGEGIGLSIVQRVLDRQNGHISVTSKADEGSCFSITLPAPINNRALS